MADVEKFAKSPSRESLDKCNKEQLLRIAEFYEITISDRRLKESTIKIELENKLVNKGILSSTMEQIQDIQAQNLPASQSVLTFDQQKELLLLQIDHERMKQ